jgi:hypothetical protein
MNGAATRRARSVRVIFCRGRFVATLGTERAMMISVSGGDEQRSAVIDNNREGERQRPKTEWTTESLTGTISGLGAKAACASSERRDALAIHGAGCTQVRAMAVERPRRFGGERKRLITYP